MKNAVFGALGLALAHLILAILFASATPYRTPGWLASQRNPQTGAPLSVPDVGAPDERQHANYVQSLLDGRGFPVFQPNSPDAGEHYEDHQPPLYYGVAALFAQVVGVSDVAAPGAARLRRLNAIVGGATVLGVFFLAFWGLERADIGLGAAAITAFLPMNCALSGAISNDPLLYALCTWTLALCALSIRRGWNWKRAIGVGLLLGGAILTKTTGVGLVVPVLFAVAYRRPSWSQVAAAVAIVAVSIGPWWTRNQRLYGDPLAMGAFNRAFTGSPQADMFIQAEGPYEYWVNRVGWWTARSFFGAFGYLDIWMNETTRPSAHTPNTIYRLLIVASLVLFLGWLATLRSETWREARGVQLMNGLFLLVVIALFLRFNQQYFQAQGRYLYPAIGPIAIALSAGCWGLWRERGRVLVGVYAGALLVLSLVAVSRLPGQFARRAGVSKMLEQPIPIVRDHAGVPVVAARVLDQPLLPG